MSYELAPLPSPDPVRTSPIRTYLTLLQWSFISTRPALPLIIAVQMLMGVSIIVGFGLLIPSLDLQTAMFLSSGAPTVMLSLVGFVVVPQALSEARANGLLDYQRSLPIPRMLLLCCDFTVWLFITLPGVAMGIVTGQLYYGFVFPIDWPLLFISAVLVALMSTAIGYAVAMACPRMIAMVVSQLLAFFVMLFSPISFPPSALPSWFQTVHLWLPFQAAGDLIRSALLPVQYPLELRDIAILGIWTLIGLVIASRILVRRQ
ncbi:ABC transporter permease [Stomatohabitans albus]|uniref:ABC transporter permease n=1 Tax=Stomatohabitans albus TaxID=3110766 RepID=UPI00300D869A